MGFNVRQEYLFQQQDFIGHSGKSLTWKIECDVEMVYNRMFLYQADVLHSQNVDLGMFTDYDRINQVLFM